MGTDRQRRLGCGLLGWAVILLTAGTAGAQFQAHLELEAPPAHPGARVAQVTLYTGGDLGTVVGQFSGLLFSSGGGVSSRTFEVTAVPDAARVVFQAPWGSPGLETTLIADPLALPAELFLPEPSPGGEISEDDLPAPNADDAVLRIDVVDLPPPGDGEAPTCDFERTPDTLDAQVQDLVPGLDELEIVAAINLDASVPPFVPGTTDPVLIQGIVEDPERTVTLWIEARDLDGNLRVCKSITRMSGGGSGGSGGTGTAGGSGGLPGPMPEQNVPALSPLALGGLAAGLVAATALARRRRRE